MPGTPVLVERVQAVLADVDEYCRSGELLMLARPPELVALSNWTLGELIAQDAGREATPWPGPF